MKLSESRTLRRCAASLWSLPSPHRVLALLFWWAMCSSQAANYATEANVMVEIPLEAKRSYTDPFNELNVDVVFTDPKGRELQVPAFWAGGKSWKVRYASPLVGKHQFVSKCSNPNDEGVHDLKGTVEIKPYTGDNPLYRCGALRVAADRHHFEHSDGTPFFWLGDTWWMGLCHRLRWPEEFALLTADRKEKGFTVVQIVAGLYPDMPPFDPRGANEAGFPWETNYARIRPEYFDAADRRLKHLVDSGITPCLVGAWGFFLPWLGVPKAEQHWRYLIARYGALPVIWCVAGESNLPYYLVKNFPYDDREQVKGWTEVARYVRRTDPFHRLITIHPTGLNRLSARNGVEDVSVLDIDILQTPHGESETFAPTVRNVRASYFDKPLMPVIDGEASYEMFMDKTPPDWPRAMFWICMLNGAAGHTYGANGIWQCNRRDQPHGASPLGSMYGKISWDEAMHLAGSRHVSLGKRLLEEYEWRRFTPHPEWATFTNEPAPLTFDQSRWIWFPEQKPTRDSPTEKRYFRKPFFIPENETITRARLLVSADEPLEVRVNGRKLGAARDWHIGKEFNDLGSVLKSGSNVLAFIGETKHAGVPADPPGFIACLEVRFENSKRLTLVSDATWLCNKNEQPQWDEIGFTVAGWTNATEVADFGDPPWGKILADSALEGPQSAGIDRKVRMTWVPKKEPVLFQNLGSSTAWSATHFDPVTGERKTLGEFRADNSGIIRFEPPSSTAPDWVLILKAK
jgi:hypothetical protein